MTESMLQRIMDEIHEDCTLCIYMNVVDGKLENATSGTGFPSGFTYDDNTSYETTCHRCNGTGKQLTSAGQDFIETMGDYLSRHTASKLYKSFSIVDTEQKRKAELQRCLRRPPLCNHIRNLDYVDDEGRGQTIDFDFCPHCGYGFIG